MDVGKGYAERVAPCVFRYVEGSIRRFAAINGWSVEPWCHDEPRYVMTRQDPERAIEVSLFYVPMERQVGLRVHSTVFDKESRELKRPLPYENALYIRTNEGRPWFSLDVERPVDLGQLETYLDEALAAVKDAKP